MDKYERAGAYRREIVKYGVCFRCNLSLQYMRKEKGYYAAIIEVNGNEVKMHQHCAIDEIEERERFYSDLISEIEGEGF